MIQCKLFFGSHPDKAFNEWMELHPLYKVHDVMYQHVEKGTYSILLVYNDGKGMTINGTSPA